MLGLASRRNGRGQGSGRLWESYGVILEGFAGFRSLGFGLGSSKYIESRVQGYLDRLTTFRSTLLTKHWQVCYVESRVQDPGAPWWGFRIRLQFVAFVSGFGRARYWKSSPIVE